VVLRLLQNHQAKINQPVQAISVRDLILLVLGAQAALSLDTIDCRRNLNGLLEKLVHQLLSHVCFVPQLSKPTFVSVVVVLEQFVLIIVLVGNQRYLRLFKVEQWNSGIVVLVNSRGHRLKNEV
jgi:hypothetical protein